MKFRSLWMLLTAAFWSSATPAHQLSTYRGEYFYNFENAVLTVADTKQRLCISGDMTAAEIPGEKGKTGWGTADVVVVGWLGPEGRYGNVGSCTRFLTVTKIVSVRNKKSR